MGRRLYLSYSDTTTISTDSASAVGVVSHSRYYDNVWFDDDAHEDAMIEHEMLDRSVKVDNLGYYLILSAKINPTSVAADFDFLTAFFRAKHKWALTVFNEGGKDYLGNFHNTDDNTSGWVKCRVIESEQHVDVMSLMEDGFTLKSEKVYTVPEVPVNATYNVSGAGNTTVVKWGSDTATYANWWDRLSKCRNPIYEVWRKKDSGSFTKITTTNSRTYTEDLSTGTYHHKIYAFNGYGSSVTSEFDITIA